MYIAKEIAELFGVHTGTVHLWSKEGLKILADSFPHLIQGEELARFLNQRQSKRKFKLAPDELFCVKCRQPRKGVASTINATLTNKRMGGGKTLVITKTQCEVCGTKMNRFSAIYTVDAAELLVTEATLVNVGIKDIKI